MHVTVALTFGGMETMISRLIEADGGKHQHWVIGLMDDTSPDPSDSYSQRLTQLGARVYSLGFQRRQLRTGSIVKLWRLYRNCSPVLLSGWSYHGNIVAVLLSLFSAG